jgi:cytoskeletal protein CcmA (bactofilin family)
MFQKKTPEETPRPSRRFTDRVGKTDTVLGQGLTFEGELKGRGNLELLGNIEGNVELEGLFLVKESGHFQGDVQATNVVVEGKVEGKILAGQKVELRSRCRVVGDIRAQSIAIADGCYFQGKVHMSGKPTAGAPGGGAGGDSGGDRAVAFQEKRKGT